MNVARLASCVIAVLVLSSCGGGGGKGSGDDPALSSRSTPSALLALKSFAPGCDGFLDYAANGLTEEYLQQFSCRSFAADAICPVFLGEPAAPDFEIGTDSNAPSRVSGTNVQEAGVDEADIVKTDSTGRLYILSGTTLTILEAFPPEQLASRELVSVDLAAKDPGFYAADLFLDEAQQRVVVQGSSFDGERSYATSVLIDVSNPAVPRETERLGVDGYPLESRRIGQRVHRISRFDVPRPEWLYAAEDSLQRQRDAYFAARDAKQDAEAERIKAEVRAEIGQRLEDKGSAALLPRSFRQLAGQVRTETLLDCADISRPDVSTGLGLALIDSFDIDGGARATSGVINNAYLVYTSPTNLYLAQPSAGWSFAPDQLEETVVYRLALSDTGPAAYRALGKVPGSVYGSYAFSEHEGHLRVASTSIVVGVVSTDPINGLSVLDAQASGEMPVVGSVSGLAAGERIQGVRLLGDRGFIVTFRQVDPLFALDLSDPRNPRVTSELKIPGFSSYLMPIGEDYLLTVGRDGTDEGLSGAVAVQLFDVSNLDDVRQVASLAAPVGAGGYSYSTAEHDPHAFSYFADSEESASPGTLTLPLTAYGETPETSFAGFLVVRVAPGTATPLSETGRIDHEQFVDGSRHPCSLTELTAIDQPHAIDSCVKPGEVCLFGGLAGIGFQGVCGPPFVEPRRAVYMQRGQDVLLYTISTLGVQASRVLQPEVILGARSLPYDPPCCFAIDPIAEEGEAPEEGEIDLGGDMIEWVK